MPRLGDTAVAEGLQHLPGWERRGNQIVKTFVREDFAHAMVFVNEVASAASSPATSSPMRSGAGPTSEWFGSPKRPATACPRSSWTAWSALGKGRRGDWGPLRA
jgi:Pterin 4 alpha carbinolamine dehydratase